MHRFLSGLLFVALAAVLVSACKPNTPPAWQQFMDCAGNSCVAQVVAVKDLYLQDPVPLFEEFIKTNERGEDHFVGWLYILRDSVLLNPAFAPESDRVAIQQALLEKSRPFENDPKYGSWAQSIISEIEPLAFASEDGDPLPANMEGHWVSTSDAKSELIIGDGRYVEIYDGKEVYNVPFRFFNACPEDCSPIAPTPCLQLMGQDLICYTVITTTTKRLELSMISGTGNTLAFVPKN